MRDHIIRHHMTNRCKGGGSDKSNRLRMKEYKEKLLHRYFGNLSWEEIGDVLKKIFGTSDPQRVIRLMERVSRMKGRT